MQSSGTTLTVASVRHDMVRIHDSDVPLCHGFNDIKPLGIAVMVMVVHARRTNN